MATMRVEPAVANQDPGADLSTAVNAEAQSEPPAFNEQTHYVPVKTIVTVSNRLTDLRQNTNEAGDFPCMRDGRSAGADGSDHPCGESDNNQ